MRTCNKCKEEKVFEEFWNNSFQSNRSTYNCKKCRRESNISNGLKRRYGITFEDKQQMLKLQKYKCALCKIPGPLDASRWHMDHSHKTNKIRGVLCQSCNLGLGQFNDDPKKLSLAITYLSKYI